MSESPTTSVETAKTQRYLTFRVDDRSYALPAEAVTEVIRTPPVARVPQGPEGLLGLANLRGAILPVASLRGLLGAPLREADESSRALVLAGASPVGLAVDAVDALVSVQSDQVETSQAMMSAQPGERLAGAFRQDDDGVLTKVLDLEGLLAGAFGARKPSRRAPPAPDADLDAAAAVSGVEARKLVVFEVAGQDYALYLDAVREIIPLPGEVAAAPLSEALVLGVADYRGGLLPLFSLRGLLGLPAGSAEALGQKVVVTTIGGVIVGLAADRMRAIVPADPELVEPTPPILSARTGGEARVSAILRRPEGGRLISILSPDAVFREEIMQRLGGVAEEAGTLAQEETLASDTITFLIFRLGEDEFALPIGVVDEVASAPAQVTRLPKGPSFLEGVINLRGDVLPVVDQRRRFHMPPAPAGLQRRLVVVRTEHHRAGLIVDSVSKVLRSSARDIDPAPDLTGDSGRLVSGLINPGAGGRIVLVLDPAELLTRAEIGLLEGFEAEVRQADQ
jgi:purine-binding chemotaxis protein CheW